MKPSRGRVPGADQAGRGWCGDTYTHRSTRGASSDSSVQPVRAMSWRYVGQSDAVARVAANNETSARKAVAPYLNMLVLLEDLLFQFHKAARCLTVSSTRTCPPLGPTTYLSALYPPPRTPLAVGR